MSSRPLCLDYGVSALSSQQGTVPTPTASSNSAVKKAMKKDSVIVHSTQITSGKLNKLDISFVPRTVSWIPHKGMHREKCELGLCEQHSGPHVLITSVFMQKQVCAHVHLLLLSFYFTFYVHLSGLFYIDMSPYKGCTHSKDTFFFADVSSRSHFA